jgi:acid phosphatase
VRDVTTKPDPVKPASKATSTVDMGDKGDMGDKPAPAPVARNNNLNAVLWVQTSAEYKALTRQTYAAALATLPRAIKDKKWTALVSGEYNESTLRGLKPAVIVDVDETMLDNSPFQATMIENDSLFDPKSWEAWTQRREARAVPGAVEFARAANDQGVQVIYVTNRNASQEEDTRANLLALGFPLSSDPAKDVILCRGEKEAWGSKKGTRRREVAKDYRVIMLIGDNLGDFVDDYKGSVGERDEIIEKYATWWGERWFMLPNPTYGSWESAVIGKEKDMKKRTDLKRGSLRR